MKALLLGANGLLGRDLLGALQQHGGVEVTAATRDGTLADGSLAERIELTAEAQVDDLLDRIRPGLIVNAAGYTAVDRAEIEESLAMRLNRDVPAQLGRWAAANNALVVHYSTDYVFDGLQQSPYAPGDATSPLGAYGRSKLAGEQALQVSGAAHLILRTAWLYGPHGKNFPLTMLSLAQERAALRVVNDQHGTPTSTRRVAVSTVAAIDLWMATAADRRSALQGVHHLVASGATTWHGFATAVIECASSAGLLAVRPSIEAVGSEAYSTRAIRPGHAVLDNSSFTKVFRTELPPWRDDVEAFILQLAASTIHTPRPG